MSKRGVFFLLACLVLLVFTAPGIDGYNHAFMASKQVQDLPFWVRFLGEGRSILSNLAILQADLYFHGGDGHFHEEHTEGLCIFERGEGCEEEAHEREETPECGKYNILFRISREIELTEHIHLEGEQTEQIVPWLYYAAKIDPHNILAYTLTSYWLADRWGKFDQAFSFLREGLANNPDSWEINAELGRLYFQHKEDYEAAVRFLTRARDLLKESPHDKFEERFVLFYLALSYEALGEKEKALLVYGHLNEIFPGAYDKKIKGLE
ncbi:MAG: tetratricopeptide repeat protein [Candidatus Omnitrophota bacterium]